MTRLINLKKHLGAPFVLTAVVIIAIFPVANYDLFWHLATGKIQFLQQKVLSEEIFSYTRNGLPWHNHTWLSSLVFFLIYNFSGYNGLIFFKAIVVAGIALVMMHLLKNKGHDYHLIIPLILLMALMGLFRFTVRPHIFSYLFLSLTYLIVHSYINSNNKYHLLFFLPVTAAVWVNLHSGVVFGLILLVSFALGEIIKHAVSEASLYGIITAFKERKVRNLMLAVPGFLAGCLVNPYGARSLGFLFSYFGPSSGVTDFLKNNMEFMPPDFAHFTLFWAALTILLVLLVARFKKINLSEALVIIPFALLAVRFSRSVAMFGIVMLPVAADLLEGTLGKERRRKVILTAFAVLMIGMVSYYKFVQDNGRYRFGGGLNSAVLPVDCVNFIKDSGISGNMYNSDAFGGYIAWMLYPDRKIFYDGRNFIFKKLYNELHSGAFLEKYNVNYAVTRRGDVESQLLFPESTWRLVFWDRCCTVYVKISEDNASFIERYGLRYFLPDNPGIDPDDKNLEQLIKEVENHLKYVDNKNAFLFLSLLYEKRGYGSLQEKLSFYLNGLRRWPGLPDIHVNLANIYYKLNDLENAKRFYKSTIELNRFKAPAYLNLGFIAYDESELGVAEKYFKKSLEHDENLALAYYGLALVFEKKRQGKKAVYYLQEYLKRASGGRWADIARDKLRKIKEDNDRY